MRTRRWPPRARARARARTARTGVGALLGLAILAAGGGGCSTVHLDPPPADVNACRPDEQFFAERIWPEFLGQTYNGQTCGDSRCHDAAAGRPLRAVMPTSLATFPFPAGSDWELSYRSVTQQLICTNARGSELFTRPAGLRTHGGGKLIEPDGPEGALLEMWVAGSP